MIIQIGFLNEATKTPEKVEPILDLFSFFVLADVLSNIIEMLKDIPDPNLKEIYKQFQKSIKENRKDSEKRFAKFWECCKEIWDEMKKESKGTQDEIPEEDEVPELSVFNPEVQAFIGQTFLDKKRTFDAKTPLEMANFVGLFCAIIHHSISQYEKSDPDYAGSLQLAYSILEILGKYCDSALAEGKSFGFVFTEV